MRNVINVMVYVEPCLCESLQHLPILLANRTKLERAVGRKLSLIDSIEQVYNLQANVQKRSGYNTLII